MQAADKEVIDYTRQSQTKESEQRDNPPKFSIYHHAAQ